MKSVNVGDAVSCYIQTIQSLLQKVESRVSSDEDLKLSELLRYYMLNIEAAKVRCFFFFFKLSFIMGIVTHSYLCLKKMGR